MDQEKLYSIIGRMYVNLYTTNEHAQKKTQELEQANRIILDMENKIKKIEGESGST